MHLALEAAGDGQFSALICLADEWQRAVHRRLGEQDLTVVTRARAGRRQTKTLIGNTITWHFRPSPADIQQARVDVCSRGYFPARDVRPPVAAWAETTQRP